MRKILNKAKVIQNLSIDISLGSVVLCAFIGEVLSLTFSFYELSALALSVFVIYNLDHLFDSRRSSKSDLTERRVFFVVNRRLVYILLSLAIIILIMILGFLPKEVFRNGIILSALVFAYFLSVHKVSRNLYHKEIAGAAVYTMGIFLLPFSHFQSFPQVGFIVLLVQFFLLALLNLMVFAFYEKEKDIRENQSSIAVSINEKEMKNFIIALGVANCLIPIFSITYSISNGQSIIPQSLILLMCVGTIAISKYVQFFGRSELYRTIGDTLFFLPLLYFL